MAFGLIFAFFLVAANGFFVAAEFSLARLRPTQADEFVRDRKPGGKSVKHAVDHIDAYLAACQLGITLSSLALGAVGEPAFEHLLEPVFGEDVRFAGIVVASIVGFTLITVLHVVLGELSPKSLALSRTAPVALLLAPPLRAFYYATKPLVDLFNGMGNLVLKPFRIPPAREAGHAPHSESELRELLEESYAGGLIEHGDVALAERSFDFGDRRVREILIPRLEVKWLACDASRDQALVLARETGYTRLPIGDPDTGLDGAVGLLNVKDLLGPDDGRTLQELARPLTRVPEGMLVAELLRELRREHRHMALVVDEHGTVIGVVTLEDLLEELVGEIEDEFDPERVPELRPAQDDAWTADGDVSMHDLHEQLGLTVEDAHEATLGGVLIERLGRLPEPGETVQLEGWQVEVVGVGEAQVTALRLQRAR